MYILNSDQTLPVKNIKFDNIKGFEIYTRYINENKFEFGLFKTNNFLTGWNRPFKITYYINNPKKFDKVENNKKKEVNKDKKEEQDKVENNKKKEVNKDKKEEQDKVENNKKKEVNKIEKEEQDKVEKYTIDIPKNSISSFITTINTGCKLIKSSFKDLNNDYKKTEKSKIPKIIIQTHKNYNFNKKEYYYASRSWILKNPGYKYVFYDNNDCIEFLTQFYEKIVLDAWHSVVPGAFKADIFRYCILYKLGGIYVDFDTICIKPLDKLFNKSTEFVSAREPENYNHLWNAFIMSKPKHECLLYSIQISIRNVLLKIKNIYHLSLTGPGVLGNALNKFLNNKFDNNFNIGTFDNIILFQNCSSPNLYVQDKNENLVMVSKWGGYENEQYWKINWYN